MKIQNGQRLLFIGDSVTDAERNNSGSTPSEGLFNPLGKGYPHIVSGLLNAVYPERRIRITNAGNGGNNIIHLKNRWQKDVIDLKPDWLSIMIGINDVWRQFDLPQIPEEHVSPELYEATLRELITETKPLLAGGIVLMTPYYIENNPNDAMRAKMDEYGAICKKVAEETGVIFVDTQKVFNKLLEHSHSAYIAWDRVHPNVYGQTALARAFLKAIDFDFDHEA